jgi:hypothetical protein
MICHSPREDLDIIRTATAESIISRVYARCRFPVSAAKPANPAVRRATPTRRSFRARLRAATSLPLRLGERFSFFNFLRRRPAAPELVATRDNEPVGRRHRFQKRSRMCEHHLTRAWTRSAMMLGQIGVRAALNTRTRAELEGWPQAANPRDTLRVDPASGV